ncbi:MAG: hypothetical protein EAX86_13435 [Candidatus Heimdallarchaeota archaeon]|nr:hypothetical protein [Candidatus Heimdallarchaeota archaeon]
MSLKDKRLPKPKRKKKPQESEKASPSSKSKRKRREKSSLPEGDGILFPRTRTPKGMDRKTAKKIKKARRQY